MKPIADIARRLLPWVALAAALVAATRFAGDAIWPCPVSCQGGGHYQRLLGVPVHVPATAVMLAVAVLAWLRRREAAWLAWVAAGGSLYFLWVAWQLGLRCPYCIAVHALVLAAAGCALAQPVRRGELPGLAAVAFFGLHFAFHPGVVADGPEAPPAAADPQLGSFFAAPARPATAAADPAAAAAVDALRRLGSPQAAYVLEVAVDLHCPHCAAAHGPLLDGLRRAIDAGRIEVVLRFLTRRSDPSGRELAEHVLAAADPAQARLLTGLLLGTPAGRGWRAVRPRVAEIADPAALEAARAARGAALAAVLDGDGARLRALGARGTPFAAIAHRGAEPYQRWDGDAFDPQAIAREIPWD